LIDHGLNKLGAIANQIDTRSKGEALINYLTETDSFIVVVCVLFADNISDVIDKTSVDKVIIVSAYDSLMFLVSISPNLDTRL